MTANNGASGKCSAVGTLFHNLCLFLSPSTDSNHGSGAECCRLLRPVPVCVPCVVARGRGPAADPQPVGADQPRRCRPVSGPWSHQLLPHL